MLDLSSLMKSFRDVKIVSLLSMESLRSILFLQCHASFSLVFFESRVFEKWGSLLSLLVLSFCLKF